MSGRSLLRLGVLLTAVAALVLGPGRASAQPTAEAALTEQILTDSAQEQVPITATFSGSEIFVFGAIVRNRLLRPNEPPPDVIIVVRGPSEPVLVRRKSRVAGVWVNTEAIRIASAPSFYAVSSTRPLDEILRPDEDLVHRISLDKAVLIVGIPDSAADPETFRRAAIRLRQRSGLYQEAPNEVLLRGKTLFQTKVRLPADITDGLYQVRVFLVRGQRVIDQARLEIPVEKEGIERLIYTAAQERPLLYGILTLLVALSAGWGASELFRRLRR